MSSNDENRGPMIGLPTPPAEAAAEETQCHCHEVALTVLDGALKGLAEGFSEAPSEMTGEQVAKAINMTRVMLLEEMTRQ